MLKRVLALLLCLLMLPVWSLAEAAEGQHFRLTFDMRAEAYPDDVQDIMPGIADLLNALTVEGTLLVQSGAFDLHAELLLNGQERTRTPLQLFGTEAAWYIRSTLLGNETLKVHIPTLLEFAVKGYSYMDVPFQRAAILISPYVHQDGMALLTQAAQSVLFAEEGSRTVALSALTRKAQQLANEADSDRSFIHWAQALAQESGYTDALISLVRQMPEWIESFVPTSGIRITVTDDAETWTAGPATILRRETDLSGAQTLSIALPPTPDGLTITFDAASQPDGDLLHASYDLLVTDEAEETVLRLHADGSLPTSLAVARPFFLTWEAEGPAVGGDGVHLYFEGEVAGQTVIIRQLTPDHATVMLTVTAELEPAQGTLTQPAGDAVELLNVNNDSLNELMGRIASPLVRGLLPLVAQAPISSCQTLMNMLENSGVFGLLTNGFSSDADEWSEEDW